jgi:hypothetical protein
MSGSRYWTNHQLQSPRSTEYIHLVLLALGQAQLTNPVRYRDRLDEAPGP